MEDHLRELVDFWLARLQERAALATDPADWRVLLREIEADRRLFRHYEDATTQPRKHDSAQAGHISGLEYAIRCRVTVHADHPDYRKEWEPFNIDLATAGTGCSTHHGASTG